MAGCFAGAGGFGVDYALKIKTLLILYGRLCENMDNTAGRGAVGKHPFGAERRPQPIEHGFAE
jgi:hypothetical protein